MDELERFCKERDAALLSLDERKIREFSEKYEIQMPENETDFWAGVHKAIVALNAATADQKVASILWLAEHGCGPGILGGCKMAEYIEREAAKKVLAFGVGVTAANALDKIPAADVVEVVHGRWIERKSLHAEGGVSAKCSVCQKAVQYLGNPLKYCPKCGARMDGK